VAWVDVKQAVNITTVPGCGAIARSDEYGLVVDSNDGVCVVEEGKKNYT
jgi:hypothetical protein